LKPGRKPILIVGGGLGGLTTALAFARKGWSVRVFEGAPEFGAIGYGIQFGPNVFHALDRIGVVDEVIEQSDSPPGVVMLDCYTGEEVTRVPTGQPSFRQRFKYPYIIIHRIDIHNILLDACARTDNIELVPEAMVTGFEDHGDGIEIATEDGRNFAGTALIGADGLRSQLRARIRTEGEPRAVGFVAHRTIVTMQHLSADVSRENVVLWGGPGFHIVHYPLRHGTLFNIVAVFRTATFADRGDVASYRAELQHTYRDAHPAMRDLLTMMDLERRWIIGDRDPIRSWSKGRMVLLGDAAHPTLQSLAQGACMAIEDGVCLAEIIARSDDGFKAAFRQFEKDRYVRTARVTLESRYLWQVFHAGGVERDVYWQMLSERSEQDTYQCLAWLYDGAAEFHRTPKAVQRTA
jgi:salicylate hydroxylase